MKKNNLFKISLLLVLNISNVYSDVEDVEVDACKMGQYYRGGNQGQPLMITGDEPLYGTTSCNSLYNGNHRHIAACIFGFNSNINQSKLYDDPANPTTSKWQWAANGNGGSTSNLYWNQGNNQPQCLIRWLGQPLCAAQNPPPAWFGSSTVNPIGICDFGDSIGWAVNWQNSLLQNNLQFYPVFSWGNILETIWGTRMGNLKNDQANEVGLANYLNMIQKDYLGNGACGDYGTDGFGGPGHKTMTLQEMYNDTNDFDMQSW